MREPRDAVDLVGPEQQRAAPVGRDRDRALRAALVASVLLGPVLRLGPLPPRSEARARADLPARVVGRVSAGAGAFVAEWRVPRVVARSSGFVCGFE